MQMMHLYFIYFRYYSSKRWSDMSNEIEIFGDQFGILLQYFCIVFYINFFCCFHFSGWHDKRRSLSVYHYYQLLFEKYIRNLAFSNYICNIFFLRNLVSFFSFASNGQFFGGGNCKENWLVWRPLIYIHIYIDILIYSIRLVTKVYLSIKSSAYLTLCSIQSKCKSDKEENVKNENFSVRRAFYMCLCSVFCVGRYINNVV